MSERKPPVLDFETEDPPVLNGRMLEAELEKRKRNCQTALLAVSGILLEICFLLAALLFWQVYPFLGAVSAGYLICSATGGGILAVLYHTERGKFLCQ